MKPDRRWMIAAAAIAIAAMVFATACGGSSAKSASSPSPSAGQTHGAGTGQGDRGNRTPDPARQTSIAQGTPGGFGDRTPPPAEQTSIAEGTPAGFGGHANGANGADATAIAQGTPASALRGQGGAGRMLATVATALAIDEAQLQSELQAPGATVASVGEAHGLDRDHLKQALKDATKQRLSDAVTSGAITQDVADQSQTQFDANIDVLLDRPGG